MHANRLHQEPPASRGANPNGGGAGDGAQRQSPSMV
jgi:hypothetical protein